MLERRLPLTPRGWTFLALSGAALTAGLFRAELAALLWGSLFFFLCLASLALTLAWAATVRRRLSTISEAPHLRCARVCLDEDEALPLSIRGVAAVASRVPAVGVVARIEWNWRDLRRAWVEIELSGDDVEHLSTTLPGRGSYEMRLVLIVRDTLGFAKISLPVRGDTPHRAENRVHVRPVAAAHALPLPRVSGAGSRTPDPRERHRTDELLEARRYVPGDDPRRINWKAFARHGELLIRIGEEVPRPRGRVLCLLHTGTPDEISGEHALALVDRSTAILLRIVEQLLARGTGCDVLLPSGGDGDADTITDTGRGDTHRGGRPDPIEQLRIRLSDVAPGDTLPPLPGDSSAHVFVVTPAGARGSIDDPLPEVTRRGLPTAVFLVAPMCDATVRDDKLLQERAERDMLDVQSSLPRNAYVELV